MAQSTFRVWHITPKDGIVIKSMKDDLDEMQEMVGGDIEMIPVTTYKSIDYTLIMNENGINLKLPENKPANELLEELGHKILGDVLIAAFKRNGKLTDMGELNYAQLKKKAGDTLKQRRTSQSQWIKEMEKMGMKIMILNISPETKIDNKNNHSLNTRSQPAFYSGVSWY